MLKVTAATSEGSFFFCELFIFRGPFRHEQQPSTEQDLAIMKLETEESEGYALLLP